MKLNKVIISGGGTGGHIFPAVAIANKIKEKYPDADILFVGAEGKMEMEKVPKAGYEIVGLPIRGLQRRLTLKNFAVPFKLLQSLNRSKKIVKNFKPQIAIGVGGYAAYRGGVYYVRTMQSVSRIRCLYKTYNIVRHVGHLELEHKMKPGL